MKERLYLLKIRLLEIEPEIWRRFVVPDTITLDRLHDVIQIVMGWTDSHMHKFIIGKKSYTEYPESKEDGLVCGKYHLGDVIKQKGNAFSYRYDFGDCWDHEVIIEKNNYLNPKLSSSIECIEGARACPPEDVGGTPGYYEFCKAINDVSHKEHDNYLGWCGGEYDSEAFDMNKINFELFKYQRWSRNRHLPSSVY
ncbi:MAG TPA: plasmid pRiA4b ORF-3 family protein [Anaerohalosphaeraceae bacterium]|nr:plasmid pRiA4b ORF-3 family protein [Anaerohalosphaeraceae bacterium]